MNWLTEVGHDICVEVDLHHIMEEVLNGSSSNRKMGPGLASWPASAGGGGAS